MSTVPRALIIAMCLCGSLSPMGLAQTAAPRWTRSAPERALRLDPDRLARLDSLFQREIDENRLAGGVALVLHRGRPAYQRAFGWLDREARRPMTADALFRIASQTKAVTSVAIMMLIEDGRLTLDQPVSRYLPAFASTTVAPAADSGRTTVPARRPITIRDLLTHTAGISYGTEPRVAARYEAAGLGPAAGNGWYTADKDEPICETMDRLGTLPFVAQPGEAFVYGYATDVLGCVVERVSGAPLDRFVRERITEPLGMKDTRFFVPAADRDRLATVYAAGAGGLVRAAEGARGQGHYVDGPRASFSGGAGLVSTARDYARFLEMLRRGGELAGVRILSPRSVAVMTTDLLGERFPLPGAGFGLGFQITTRLGGASGGYPSVGSYGWGGAYFTSYLVDPVLDLVFVFMSQHLPSGGSDVATRFMTVVYSALQ